MCDAASCICIYVHICIHYNGCRIGASHLLRKQITLRRQRQLMLIRNNDSDDRQSTSQQDAVMQVCWVMIEGDIMLRTYPHCTDNISINKRTYILAFVKYCDMFKARLQLFSSRLTFICCFSICFVEACFKNSIERFQNAQETNMCTFQLY